MRKILLISILIIGVILRFTNLNWDEFHAFHPDERNISWAVTRISFFDQLNPQFFAYGGLPIYLYRALAEAVAQLTQNPSWVADWGKIAVVGRAVSAAISSVSIYLIFLTGELYFSPAVGLLAAFFLALSPWSIQHAHYSTTETLLVFFLLLLLIEAKFYLKDKSKHKIFIMGITLGLALATKTTALSFSLIPLCAITLSFFDKSMLKQRCIKKKLFNFTRAVILLIIVAVLTGFIASPYTVLDFPHFAESMRYESAIATGKNEVVYTLQFRNTMPYLYQLKTMVWQSGIVPVLGTIGLVLLIFLTKKTKSKNLLVFLIFPLVYAAIVGGWYAKFSRYNNPFLLFATIASAWLLMELFARPQKSLILIIGRIGLLVALAGFQLWWGLAFFSIYLQPQTRIQASRWIYNNIPKGTLIFSEHWNDGLPVDLPEATTSSYNRELLTVYEPDTPKKLLYYIDKLTNGQYIILATKRIWYTMPYLQDKYPITSKFYKELLAGNLGYQEVANFTSYPSLGVTINDDAAEETIQVFDHPVVRIFKKTHLVSEDKLRKLLAN